MPTKLKTEMIHKEIDLIQGCINRMAHNSFLIKGWYVSLAIVLLVFKSSYVLTVSILIGVITIVFWILDAYFLSEEREYRNLYSIRLAMRKDDQNIDDLYKLDISTEWTDIIKSMFSVTLCSIYLGLGAILTFVNILINSSEESERFIIDIFIH